jgi:hypothetical protein
VEGIQDLRGSHEVASFCCVKRGGSDLDRAPFEHCVLETERMETSGNSLDFETENVLNGSKNCFIVKFVTS